MGNRKTQAETVGATSTSYAYGYDELNRLVQVANGTPTAQENFTYDPLGNRTKKTVNATTPVTTLYGYDAADQLNKITDATGATNLFGFVFDAAGNLTKRCEGGAAGSVSLTGTAPITDCSVSGAASSVLGLSYDSLNRLSAATRTGLGAVTQSYGYDDGNRRVRKVSAGTSHYYHYNGSDIWAEYSAWSKADALYTQGPASDDPLIRLTITATNTFGQADYFHSDGLGSIVALSNNLNTSTQTQRFDAWGNKLAGTVTQAAQYGYTGREPDETGLMHYRARYYDA